MSGEIENHLFAGLSPEEAKRLSQASRLRRYAVGETVYRAGEPGAELLLLLQGAVKVWVPGPRPLILEIVLPEEVFGEFSLDGQSYQLTLNDKVNSLHGGTKGFDKHLWRIVSMKDGPTASVVMALTSPDGDQGYPGKVDATVTYSLDEAGSLTIAFEAKTDKPTIVNMTNHAIFNLNGEGSPLGATFHKLTIPAATFTPVDAKLIPTGERKPVAGTVFDFRAPRVVADGIRNGNDQQIRYGQGSQRLDLLPDPRKFGHGVLHALAQAARGEQLAARAGSDEGGLRSRLPPRLVLNCGREPLVLGQSLPNVGDVVTLDEELGRFHPTAVVGREQQQRSTAHGEAGLVSRTRTSFPRRVGLDRLGCADRIGPRCCPR